MLKTLDQIKEYWGNVPLHFSTYYKYTFIYYGTSGNGEKVCVGVGGDADLIYGWEVDVDKTETLNVLEDLVLAIEVYSPEGDKIADWDDF